MQTAQQAVLDALDLAKKRRDAAPESAKPRADAVVAVLNADAIDRRTNRTVEGIDSPGLQLAHRVLARWR